MKERNEIWDLERSPWGRDFMSDHRPFGLASSSPGRVRDVLIRQTSAGEGVRMYLSVETEAPLRHLEYCFGDDFTYRTVPDRRRSHFNVLTKWREPELAREAEDLITLLNETLSLPRVGSLDLATVLDWSALAAERTLGSVHQQRSRTPGDLIERAQTAAVRPRVGSLAIHSLIEELTNVVYSHPAYRDAAVIVGGPDALGDVPNLRTQLAEGLAAATGKQLVILRWPVWQISGSAPNLSSLDQRLSGSCIVVDDVWTDGRAMSSIGRLARSSGAEQAFGLAVTLAHSTEVKM